MGRIVRWAAYALSKNAENSLALRLPGRAMSFLTRSLLARRDNRVFHFIQDRKGFRGNAFDRFSFTVKQAFQALFTNDNSCEGKADHGESNRKANGNQDPPGSLFLQDELF